MSIASCQIRPTIPDMITANIKAAEVPGTRRSGGRAGRAERRKGGNSSLAPSIVRRRIPTYDLLDDEALCAIED